MARVPTAPGQSVFPGAQRVLPQSLVLAARTGREVERLGAVVATGIETEQITRAHEASSRAFGAATQQMEGLREELEGVPVADRPTVARARMLEIRESLSGGLEDERAQLLFQGSFDTVAERWVAAIDKESRALESEQQRVGISETVASLVPSYLAAPDAETRSAIEGTLDGILDGAEELGVISPTESQRLEEGFAKAVEVEQAARSERAASRLYSDLKIGIARDQVGTEGYSVADSLFSGGFITAEQRATLYQGIDTAIETQRTTARSLARVYDAMNGGTPLDPMNDQEPVDLVWEAAGVDRSTEGYEDAALTFSAKSGIVPTAVQVDLRSALHGGTPSQQAEAATLYARFVDIVPGLAIKMPENTRLFADTVADSMRISGNAEVAVENAKQLLDVDRDTKRFLAEQFRLASQDVNFAVELQKRTGATGSWTWIGRMVGAQIPPREIPAEMVGQYRGEVEREYVRNGGNLDLALRSVELLQRNVWNASYVHDEKGEWLPLPPEAVHGRPDEDPSWIREDFRASVGARIEKGEIPGPLKHYHAVADAYTTHQPGTDWAVVRKHPDLPISNAYDANGELVRWRPERPAEVSPREQGWLERGYEAIGEGMEAWRRFGRSVSESAVGPQGFERDPQLRTPAEQFFESQMQGRVPPIQ